MSWHTHPLPHAHAHTGNYALHDIKSTTLLSCIIILAQSHTSYTMWLNVCVCTFTSNSWYLGDATTMPIMNYNVPSSSAFMMPGGSLTMPHQPITTMHNPSYLSPLPPSSVSNTKFKQLKLLIEVNYLLYTDASRYQSLTNDVCSSCSTTSQWHTTANPSSPSSWNCHICSNVCGTGNACSNPTTPIHNTGLGGPLRLLRHKKYYSSVASKVIRIPRTLLTLRSYL